MCKCTIVVFLDFSRCFLVIFYVRPSQVLSKPYLIALRRLAVVGLKQNFGGTVLVLVLAVWARMLFSIASDCCVSRGTFHITPCLFMVPFIIYCPFFWTDISFFYSVMVHPSSHKTPDDISGAVFIFGEI